MKMHKTPRSQRETYTYRFANGEKITLRKGENGITEDWIRELHLADDREVENNLKQAHSPAFYKHRQEIQQWEAEHPGNDHPLKWNISLNALQSDDDGESTEDRDLCLIDKKASDFYSDEPSAAVERLREVIASLPKKQAQALTLTAYEGYSQREAAKIMHCSEANISRLLKSAKDSIRKDEKLKKLYYSGC